ncbi:CYTH domain-containing protein [Adhaeribacter sp. BT258]|uniref:CYTH domain-containing protein n=1 Tax=Adhaeribacter terrigena TaxID=2793070 RepID=A0ABS1C4A3_9BACT|nr:CYTH domain-containing protein [Adhaeribacter terrigena]MBK0404190.1 CYTH domain-containing protein [Adhaeribacter terrigena]
MPVEIERKFLVDKTLWQKLEKPEANFFRQGYLHTDPEKTIRVRVTNTSGYITIKGATTGASRLEYEYEIPKTEATELLDQFAETSLIKNRYILIFEGKTWEVDEFLAENEGLLVAEIELESEDEKFEKPDWVTEEVTGQKKYYNAQLAVNPYKNW